jgi:hypothetical protein
MDITAWRRICENSVDKSWFVAVTCDGSAESIDREIPLMDTASTAGLLVGSSHTCHIVLSDPSVPALASRITAAGMHLLVQVIAGSVRFDQVSVSLVPGAQHRFDGRPLVIGRHTVTISIRPTTATSANSPS